MSQGNDMRAIRVENVRDGFARGWSFTPLNGKRPTLTRWPQRKRESVDEALAWARAGNVGLRTGRASGIVVIDADRGADVAALSLPPTVTVLTGGGGRHFYFRHRGPLGNSAGRLCPHIDVRGDGGQVVYPGSTHPETGEPYQWADNLGPRSIAIAQLPLAIAERLTAPTAEPATTPAARAATGADDGLLRRADAYAAMVPGVPEGHRNDAAFKLAGHLAALVGDGGECLPEAAVLGLCREWNAKCTPPLADRELSQAVRSALNGHGTPRPPKPPTKQRDPRRPWTKPPIAIQEQVLSTSTAQYIPEWRPFPADVLPWPVGAFVGKAAEAIGCDPAIVALPLLAGLASAVGNTRRIELKRGWSEPAILWAVPVAESGDLKSPALEAALRPIRRRQAEAMKCYAADLAAFKADELRHGIALAAWKRDGGAGEPPAEPVAPVAERLYCDDTTIEALGCLLQTRWRGLLAVRDELSGWLASFDAYRQGKGGDAAKWIELHGGRPVVVDRKTGTPTIFIPRAAVSLTGTIQPAVLQRALGRHFFENGLAARLLLAAPPRQVRQWSDATVDHATEAVLSELFDRLYSLQPRTDPDGEPEPVILPLSADAKAVWITFYNDHAKEHAELTGDLAAAWSKLEGYAARLALVIHCCRWAARDSKLEHEDVIDAASVESGVALSRWFAHETRRVYALLTEGEGAREQRELIDLIRRLGGRATPRDLSKHCRAYPTADVAEAALDDLADAGLGSWESPASGERGGRPSLIFRLTQSVDVDKTP